MKCAIIGYGYWGKIIEKYICSNGRFVIEAIVDIGNIREGEKHISYTDVLANTEIEAVFICTPPSTHYQLVMQALKKNKHVFCEKPLALQTSQVQMLYELACKADKVLFVDYIYLYSKAVQKMIDLSSGIGEIVFIESRIMQKGRLGSDSVYASIGIHLMYVLYRILTNGISEGSISVDIEDYVISPKGIEYSGCVRFLISEKVKAIVFCSLVSPQKERQIRILGKDGSISFDMLDRDTVKYSKQGAWSDSPDCEEIRFGFDERNNLGYSIDAFFQSILNKDLAPNADISYFIASCLSKYDPIDE